MKDIFGKYGNFESMIDTLILDARKYQQAIDGTPDVFWRNRASISMNTIRDEILAVWDLNNQLTAIAHTRAMGEMLQTIGANILKIQADVVPSDNVQ
jgi:hypothetical protein